MAWVVSGKGGVDDMRDGWTTTTTTSTTTTTTTIQKEKCLGGIKYVGSALYIALHCTGGRPDSPSSTQQNQTKKNQKAQKSKLTEKKDLNFCTCYTSISSSRYPFRLAYRPAQLASSSASSSVVGSTPSSSTACSSSGSSIANRPTALAITLSFSPE